MSLLALAGIWGWWRHIDWWMNLTGDPKASWAALSLAAGIIISWLSTQVFKWRYRRGNRAARWVYSQMLRPIFGQMPPRWGWALAIASALCEEIFFRGVLLPEAGLWPSAIIFGALHSGHRHLTLWAIWAGVLGLVMGVLVQQSGTLWPAVALHFGVNATSFALLRNLGRRL